MSEHAPYWKGDPVREIWLPVILFLATLGSTFWAGWGLTLGFLGAPEVEPESAVIVSGAISYSVSLLLILFTHEMGHFLMARRLGVPVSLPFSIPVPPPFWLGTFGAIIRLRGLPQDRSTLLKVGAAGPIAGGVVALVVMVLGVWSSTPIPNVEPTGGDVIVFGDSLATLALQSWIWPNLGDDQTLLASPMFMAGWAGFLITMLNLIPLGQLDGGHVGYAVLGERLNKYWWIVGIAVAALAVVGWLGYLVFGGMAFFFGRRHFQVPDSRSPLDRSARWLAIACLVTFALTFMPAPIHMNLSDFISLVLETPTP